MAGGRKRGKASALKTEEGEERNPKACVRCHLAGKGEAFIAPFKEKGS